MSTVRSSVRNLMAIVMQALDKLDVCWVVTFHWADQPHAWRYAVEKIEEIIRAVGAGEGPDVRSLTVPPTLGPARSAMTRPARAGLEAFRNTLTIVVAKATEDAPSDSEIVRLMTELRKRLSEIAAHTADCEFAHIASGAMSCSEVLPGEIACRIHFFGYTEIRATEIFIS